MNLAPLHKFGAGTALRSRQRAFSLIEVALAIAIVAVAFVGILGLLPTGMNTFRRSVDITIGTQIVQRLVNEVKQTNWTDVVKTYASGPVRRYYDEQGDEVSLAAPAAGAKSRSYIYYVEIRVSTPTPLPNGPGLAQLSALSSANLGTVDIRIANDPGHRGSTLDSSNHLLPYNEYFAYVARNQDTEP